MNALRWGCLPIEHVAFKSCRVCGAEFLAWRQRQHAHTTCSVWLDSNCQSVLFTGNKYAKKPPKQKKGLKKGQRYPHIKDYCLQGGSGECKHYYKGHGTPGTDERGFKIIGKFKGCLGHNFTGECFQI